IRPATLTSVINTLSLHDALPISFGDAEAMSGLVDHVLELTAPRNVTLQVVPVEARLHACLDGPLQILETAEGRRLAYSEGQKNRSEEHTSELQSRDKLVCRLLLV